MKLLIIFFLFLALLFNVSTTDALSCKGGRGACVLTCHFLNCANGMCTSVPDGTCICSRCDKGKPAYHS